MSNQLLTAKRTVYLSQKLIIYGTNGDQNGEVNIEPNSLCIKWSSYIGAQKVWSMLFGYAAFNPAIAWLLLLVEVALQIISENQKADVCIKKY